MLLFMIHSCFFIMLQIFFWGVFHNRFKNPVEIGKAVESTVKGNRRNTVHTAGG